MFVASPDASGLESAGGSVLAVGLLFSDDSELATESNSSPEESLLLLALADPQQGDKDCSLQ